MRAMVTGVAGFIGSTLADALLEQGWQVEGVDCFSGYYAEAQKRANVAAALDAGLRLHQLDLAAANLDAVLDGVDVVFHQAAQPGVRGSWASGFAGYLHDNVLATQRLLEAARDAGTGRFVYASSSSVYGNAVRYPTREQDPTRPYSPYGVTKLAGENLVLAYAHNFGLATAALRYHTVYGPRQRPDMATHRLVEAARHGTAFRLFAAGDFTRDFTYVGDVVRANLLAATADLPAGTVLNISGGESTTMSGLVDLVGETVGRPVRLEVVEGQAGDVRRTDGDASRAAELLGWQPLTGLHAGLRAQADWHASSAFVPAVPA